MSQIKLLTIDDEEIIRESIVAYFEDCDFDVFDAESGESGLEIAEKERPDIILTDLNMPGIDGFEVVKTIKATYPEIPVVVISGAGMIEDSIKAIRDGAWDYITKPIIDMAELEHTVSLALEKAELLNKNKHYQEDLEREVAKQTTELRELNEKLEQKVEERTRDLSESYETLKQTQTQLVESEKMAALGGLVAGVAHEINTPVGIGVTAASHLEEKAQKFNDVYKNGKLSRKDFENFLSIALESSRMILSNMNRAAELIQSFKQVAVDQSSEATRTFNLNEYIREVLISLHPKFKNTQYTIDVECDDKIIITTYPGALSQILTNFAMNTLKHGFDGIKEGKIAIVVTQEDSRVTINYTDNGHGIPQENLSKIFDPFFTTKRGQGGSGLGMHIVYNLVTQTLKGTIKCSSEPEKGTCFIISIPMSGD